MEWRLTSALIVVAVLAIWFSGTRAIAISAIAILSFMFPWLTVAVFTGSAVFFYLFRIRK